jgi:DNA-binding response OmpR family regulator
VSCQEGGNVSTQRKERPLSFVPTRALLSLPGRPTMRILVVSDSRSIGVHLKQVLCQSALTAELVTLEMALAVCDRPVILYHAPRWDAGSSKAVQRLGEQTEALFVVCPDVLRTAVRLAIARSGAQDGFPEDVASVRLLALQVQRFLVRGAPTRLELGPLVLDVLQGTLSTAGRTHPLTPSETRLLLALWPTSAAAPGTGLPGHELAALARMPAPSVRNHAEYLRFKLADLVGDTVAVLHQRGCGYRLALQRETPSANEDTSAR